MAIIKTEQLTKDYGSGDTAVRALDGVNIQVESGELVAVMGPSGCGKSTLLQLLGGLDAPTSGKIWLEDTDLATLDDDEITLIRRRRIGFIFQFFNLIPVLTAGENVALPLILDGAAPAVANQKAMEWMERMGIADRWSHRPKEMSGGQQQRVAVARALVSDPAIILGDEPTGNLDSKSAEGLIAVLENICSEFGRTILMVTHDPRMADHASRVINIMDGQVVDVADETQAIA
jgi:putative ABC transport system ATP-binding protein